MLKKSARQRKNPKRTSSHSTMTASAKRALGDLAAALGAQGDTVAAGLEERLATVLEDGEEMPDVRLLLRLFERLLGRSANDLDDTDADGWRKAMRLSALRFECGKAKVEVHAAVVKIRKATVELFGSKQCRFQLGLSLRTPRGAADLALEARRLVSRLADSAFKLPRSLLPGLEADPEGWVRQLLAPLERLEGLLGEIEVQRIAVSDGVIARKKALAANHETCQLVMGASEALFALAGEKELARRLRPRRRRRRDAAKPAPRRATGRLRSGLAAILEWLRRGLRRLKATAGALLGPGSRKSAESRVFPLSAGSLTARKA
jgi:hypothetical protein